MTDEFEDAPPLTPDRTARLQALKEELVGGLLLSIAEVAEILDLHPRTVGDYVRDGKLHGLQFSGAWKVPETSLRAFVQQSRGGTMTVDYRQAQLAFAVANADLATAALWVSAEDFPDFDIKPYLVRLDALGEEVRRAVAEGARPIDALTKVVQEGAGIRPGRLSADTVYFHQVLDNGEGVQMSCCGVWTAVANRAGIQAHGIDLPGWYMMRLDGEIVDPYSVPPKVFTVDEAVAFITQLADRRGIAVRPEPAWLDNVGTTADYLIRLNANLRRVGSATVVAKADTRISQLAHLATGVAAVMGTTATG